MVALPGVPAAVVEKIREILLTLHRHPRGREMLAQMELAREESRKQAIALAETLAANGTSWLLANDFIGIEEVIDSQNSYPGLRYAMFHDLQGRVLGYTRHEAVGRYVGDPQSRGLLGQAPTTQVLIDDLSLIDVAHPVTAGEQHIGWRASEEAGPALRPA